MPSRGARSRASLLGFQRPPLHRHQHSASTPRNRSSLRQDGANHLVRSVLVVLPDFDGLLRATPCRSVAPCCQSWGPTRFQPPSANDSPQGRLVTRSGQSSQPKLRPSSSTFPESPHPPKSSPPRQPISVTPSCSAPHRTAVRLGAGPKTRSTSHSEFTIDRSFSPLVSTLVRNADPPRRVSTLRPPASTATSRP